MTEAPRAIIEPYRVMIDGVELPGLIAEDGVEVLPGGHSAVNRARVTFLCGNVTVEDVGQYERMELCDGTVEWSRKSE